MPPTNVRERELRAKYLDWCSARLADRFLALSPDEIYELAERASHGRTSARETTEPPDATASHAEADSPDRAEDAPAQPPVNGTEPDSFRILVARVAEVLADTLPTFEEWVVAYEQEPERIDGELLGFWQEKTDSTGEA